MESRQIGLTVMGVILIVVSLFSPQILPFIQANVAIVDGTPPEFYGTPPSFPYGNLTLPASLTQGMSYSIWCKVNDNVSFEENLNVSVTIYVEAGDAHAGYPVYEDMKAKLTYEHGIPIEYLYHYVPTEYVVPDDADRIYRFVFRAIDENSNVAFSTQYATTGTVAGELYLNGVRVTDVSVHRLQDPDVVFQVDITQFPTLLSDIEIDITENVNFVPLISHLTLSGGEIDDGDAPNSYGVSYTFPNEGIFYVRCRLIDTNNQPVTLSIIQIPYGAIPEDMSGLIVRGVGVMVGALCIVLGNKKKLMVT